MRVTDALATTTARATAMVASVDPSGSAPSEISNSMIEENITKRLEASEIKKISNKSKLGYLGPQWVCTNEVTVLTWN